MSETVTIDGISATFDLDAFADDAGARGRMRLYLAQGRRVYAAAQARSVGDLLIGHLPANVVREAVARWLCEHAPSLLRLDRICFCSDVQTFSAEQARRSFGEALLDAEEELPVWATARDWFALRHASQYVVVDGVLGAGSILAYVDEQHALALAGRLKIGKDDLRATVTQILVDERGEIEADWPEEDPTHQANAADMHRRLHEVRVVLGDTDRQTQPKWPRRIDEAACLEQRRIVALIHDVSPEDRCRARMALRSMRPDRRVDTYTLAMALAAATHDVEIWDACAQIRTSKQLEEQLDARKRSGGTT